MKKLFFAGLCVVLALMLNGCSSVTPAVNATTANIPSPGVGVAPLTPDNYTILGRVSGTGEVSFDSRTNKYTGDTLKYGSFGDLGSIGHIQNVSSTGLFGIQTGTASVVTTPSNSREMAIGNATYILIERARAMDADAVIFVTTTVEAAGDAGSGKTTSKATVSGIAIKMN